MATNSQNIVRNFQLKYQNFFEPVHRDVLEHETGVILGETAPTAQEISFAVAKYQQILATGQGELTPFEQACYDLASGS